MEGRVVGLDVGNVRTGVAVSDPLGLTAQAREVIAVTTPAQDVEAVRRIVDEVDAVRVVVGLPLDQNGEPGPQARKVMVFVEVLRQALDVEVETIDERFSTAQAERSLIQADMKRKKRKEVIDMVAAQGILQTWLDRQAAARRRGQ